MKKQFVYLVLAFFLSISASHAGYVVYSTQKSAETELECYRAAYWDLFQRGYKRVSSNYQANQGALLQEFIRQSIVDTDDFIRNYFRENAQQAGRLRSGSWQGTEFNCRLKSMVLLDKIEAALAKLSTDQGVIGHRGSYQIAIISDPANGMARAFAKRLQAKLRDEQHEVFLVDTSQPVGTAENACERLKQLLASIQSKSGFGKAKRKYQQRVKECDLNADIDFAIDINSVSISGYQEQNAGKDVSATIAVNMDMMDVQSGRRSESVDIQPIHDSAYGLSNDAAKTQLANTLLAHALNKASRSIGAIFLNRGEQSDRKTTEQEMTGRYRYSVHLHNVSGSQFDRSKIKLVRDTFLPLGGCRLQSLASSSTASIRALRCASDTKMLADDFIDALYQTASAQQYQINIVQKNNQATSYDITFQ